MGKLLRNRLRPELLRHYQSNLLASCAYAFRSRRYVALTRMHSEKTHLSSPFRLAVFQSGCLRRYPRHLAQDFLQVLDFFVRFRSSSQAGQMD